MKLFYGGVPYNTTKVKHYEISTNDCDMESFDLQTGKTAVAKGKKITGTGKAFEFAFYGAWTTNLPIIIPVEINVIQISSIAYPIKTLVSVYDITSVDFSVPQTIAEAIIDGTNYPIVVSMQSGMLNISCDRTIDIELFYGKDRYVKYG